MPVHSPEHAHRRPQGEPQVIHIGPVVALSCLHFTDQRYIEDEYHILMTCPHYVDLRVKLIKKQYYIRPSMHKFQKLLTTTCKRDLFRLMTFIELCFKDYNNRLTCS